MDSRRIIVKGDATELLVVLIRDALELNRRVLVAVESRAMVDSLYETLGRSPTSDNERDPALVIKTHGGRVMGRRCDRLVVLGEFDRGAHATRFLCRVAPDGDAWHLIEEG